MGPPGGVIFHRLGAFWLGTGVVTAGVLFHLPMYFGARETGFHLRGMPMDGTMKLGMALVGVGLAVSVYGLIPPRRPARPTSALQVRPLDDARLSAAHVGLLLVLAAAVTIDVMKPVTLSFVVPGMTEEYGLRSGLDPGGGVPVAWLPFAGIAGTVLGSLIWGWLGDRVGRRTSILLAGVVFIATSACGSMPSFGWNVAMCFAMGLGVGGMLPIAFALMAEIVPARHRSWLMVLVGGDVAGAYVITSWLAAELTPTYGWRILWLLGLPTGVALLLLSRWIPESPRYLIHNGREDEARAVMARYGAAVLDGDRRPDDDLAPAPVGRWRLLLRPPFGGLTGAIAVFGVGVGLVTFGFQLWIPTNLQRLGLDEVTSASVLRDSALLGLPTTFLIAWLYGFWSSKKTMILVGVLTAASLACFVVLGDDVVAHRLRLDVLLVIPITGISSLLAVLIAYASEAFPTSVRARATGLAAGASKLGGVVIIAAVVAGVAAPSITATALLGAIPIVAGVVAIATIGVETRRRPLEAITAGQLRSTPHPAACAPSLPAGEAP